MRILGTLVFLALAAPLPAAPQSAGPLPEVEADIRAYTLRRADRQASSLTRDPRLAEIARAHSRDMFRSNTLGHELNGIGPGQRVARDHRRLFGLVAENVAVLKNWREDTDPATRLVDDWMQSPGHRKNILAPYDTFEVGCHGTGSAIFCTQLFVRSSTRLDEDVGFRQRPGAALSLDLAEVSTEVAEQRVAIARVGASAKDPGAVVANGAATVSVPNRPGLHRLELWTRESSDAPRYRIIGGPYVCIAAAPDEQDTACPIETTSS